MARSKAQKAHVLASMAKINSGNKENADPPSGNSSDENSSNSKADKIKALVDAVRHHNNGQQAISLPVDENSIQVDVPSDLDEEESDWE